MITAALINLCILIMVIGSLLFAIIKRLGVVQKQIEDIECSRNIDLSIISADAADIWLKLDDHDQSIMLLDDFIDFAASSRVPDSRSHRKQGR